MIKIGCAFRSHVSPGKHKGVSYDVAHTSGTGSIFNADRLLITIITGGVVTLDPCGHLCSLDGVQVTVPTPLTQGKMHMHTHTHINTWYSTVSGRPILYSLCHGRHTYKL